MRSEELSDFCAQITISKNGLKDHLQTLTRATAAVPQGVDVAADMYVYTAGGTGLNVTVPSCVWADGIEKGLERLRDPAGRARIKKEVRPDRNLVGRTWWLRPAGGRISCVGSYTPELR